MSHTCFYYELYPRVLVLASWNQGVGIVFANIGPWRSSIFLFHLFIFILFLFFNTKKTFCIGVQPINNVVIVSGQQQRDLAIHTPESTLPQTPLPSSPAHNTEQRAMTVNITW